MSSLETALKAEIAVVQQLLDLVREEYNALIRRSIEEVLAFSQQKEALLSHLAKTGSVIESLLAAPIETAPHKQTPHKELIEQLRTIAREAKEINRLNGLVIQERLRYNTKALDTILAAASHPQTYDASGHTSGMSRRRIIDAA